MSGFPSRRCQASQPSDRFDPASQKRASLLLNIPPIGDPPFPDGSEGKGVRYLPEGVSLHFARLLGEDHQLLALLLPLVDVEEAGQQAHQQHEGDEAQHGEDGHGQRRQLVGCGAKQERQSALSGSPQARFCRVPSSSRSGLPSKIIGGGHGLTPVVTRAVPIRY